MGDYSVKEIPLRKVARRDFRAPDGRILPNLPYFYLERYLKRGFTLITDPDEPRMDKTICPKCEEVVWGDPELAEHTCKVESKEFVCDVCGDSFTKKIALAGHCRTHKSK